MPSSRESKGFTFSPQVRSEATKLSNINAKLRVRADEKRMLNRNRKDTAKNLEVLRKEIKIVEKVDNKTKVVLEKLAQLLKDRNLNLKPNITSMTYAVRCATFFL